MPALTLELPIAILSCSCTIMGMVAIDEGSGHAEKALALDNELAEAHASRGLALSLGQRYEEATENSKRRSRWIQFLRSALLLRPRLLHPGQAGAGSHAFRAGGENKPDDSQALCLLIQFIGD